MKFLCLEYSDLYVGGLVDLFFVVCIFFLCISLCILVNINLLLLFILYMCFLGIYFDLNEVLS